MMCVIMVVKGYGCGYKHSALSKLSTMLVNGIVDMKVLFKIQKKRKERVFQPQWDVGGFLN